MRNPYTITFGKTPLTFFPRNSLKQEIINEFSDEIINEQVYVILGVRGSGKTVFMTDIAETFRNQKDWLVIDLNTVRNPLEDFVAILRHEKKLSKIFQSAKIDFSYLGFDIGIELSKDSQIANTEQIAKEMIYALKKSNKRILVTLDEITNSPEMREFSHSFQSFTRENLPVFVLATGTYQNIEELEKDKRNSFFARAPKIKIGSLKIKDIAKNYLETFSLSDNDSREMALLTKGYSYAFQALGYYTWKNNGNYNQSLPDYETTIFDSAYSLIWSELSQNDKEFCYGIAKSKNGKTSEVIDVINWKINKVGPYRKRLLKRGLINTEKYGYTTFLLPSFDKFVIEKYEDELWENG